jgi:hypothetical protein
MIKKSTSGSKQLRKDQSTEEEKDRKRSKRISTSEKKMGELI